MADYSRTETLTRRVIYSLPSPTPYAEVDKAVVAARREWEKLHGKECTWDNIPMVEAYDDQVHIWFEVEEKP